MNRELKEILKKKFDRELNSALSALNEEMRNRPATQDAPEEILLASKELIELMNTKDAMNTRINELNKVICDSDYRICNSNVGYELKVDRYYSSNKERAALREEIESKNDNLMLKLSLEKNYDAIVTILADAGITL